MQLVGKHLAHCLSFVNKVLLGQPFPFIYIQSLVVLHSTKAALCIYDRDQSYDLTNLEILIVGAIMESLLASVPPL